MNMKRQFPPAPKSRRGVRAPAPISIYRRSNAEIEQALLSGGHPDELAAYFGEAGYAELTELARNVSQRGVRRGAERVLILPGIMGTKLGIPGGGLLGMDDVIWLDPKDVAIGTLTQLSLGPGGSPKIAPLGAMLLFYLKLKLRLRAAGFDAEFWDYDWRRSVRNIGARFAKHLAGLPGKVHVVAHSMGGLVSRAAMKQGAASRINRLVMLGTPNHGSFLATQAVRATLDTVRQIAALDPVHSAEELCEKVFNTFPGLYSLLPSPEKFSAFDVFNPDVWPADPPRPAEDLLREARELPGQLAPANDRCHLIAGVNQPTVTGLELKNQQFIYTETPEGDGTVPLAFARLEGATAHYVEESHGSLPNNALVARAVADLLRTGQTGVLPAAWTPSRAAAARKLTDPQLRGAIPGGKRRPPPAPPEARELLARFCSATARETAAGEPRPEVRFDSLVVGRRRQHRLDICLAQGDISQASARALVLGLFREVRPAGAARDIDLRMNGAISEMVARRMFAGNVGEVFVLPTGRHPVRADLVVFAGLGTFDTFQTETLQLVAENTIRTLIRTDVEDFATVLLGGNSGQSVAAALEHLLRGFLRGLLDADRDGCFRRVTFCESDPARFAAMREELYRLAGTPLLKDVEITFDERILPALEPPPPPMRGLSTISARTPNYLIIRQEAAKGGLLTFRSSILTAGAKATVVTGTKQAPAKALKQLLDRLGPDKLTSETLPACGSSLAKLLLADEVLALLPKQLDRQLVVVHDAPSSRVPWETLHLNGQFPALDPGLSRRYLADNLSVTKWLEDRRQQPFLEVLLVINPTADLQGARDEGEQLAKKLAAIPNVRLTVRRETEASKPTLLADFRSGRYDLVHYAGHAFFDEKEPSRSGIQCAGREVLSGAELAGLGSLPNLMVFNACEAGRIRGGAKRPRGAQRLRSRPEEAVGLAEAFLRGGIANYVGTYWPVGDAAAKSFAETFYAALLRGESIGDALLKARNQVRALDPASVDWADYIHYGDFNFTVKQPR